MQATVRMTLVNQFKDRLKKGSAVTLKGYNLGEIQPKFCMVKKALRLSFLSSTKVEPCPNFSGSFYGFDFRGNKLSCTYVIGHVTACEDLDMYDKNGKSGKKKPLTLVDHEGNELQCTLWSAFSQQFNDFLTTCTDHGKIILVLQLAMMKIWDGKMWLFAREDVEKKLENTTTHISTNSKNSTKETFIGKNPPRNIAELLDVAQAVVDRSAYQLCDKYAKGEQNDQLPTEITSLISKKYAFKVSIDEYNVKKLLPLFTVLRLSDDLEILASIRLSVTPSKMDSEATSSALPNITPLDLESQTNENTMPVSTHKNNVVDDVEQKMLRMGRINDLLKLTSSMTLQLGRKWLLNQEFGFLPISTQVDMKPDVNDEKPDEYYYEIEAEEQKRWKLESEREARLEGARKQREAHWLELEAIRMAEEEYEEDHVVEEKYDKEDDEDNEIDNYDYDDLHLAYLGDKSPKL
ncbi:replication protein A 70 kDa DNA-binding subunit B [Tanacetum coccineum]